MIRSDSEHHRAENDRPPLVGGGGGESGAMRAGCRCRAAGRAVR